LDRVAQTASGLTAFLCSIARVAQRVSRFWLVPFAMSAWLGLSASAVAQAQNPAAEFTPKDFSTVDANGVDVAERSLNLGYSISIGDPQAGGLSYSANYSDLLWRLYPSVVAYARFDRLTDPDTQTDYDSWALHVRGRTEAMEYTGAGPRVGELGSRLSLCTTTLCAASATLADGTLVEFNSTPISVSSTGTIFWVTSMTSPSGERVEYHYRGSASQPGSLRSITTNSGYQLRFELADPSSAHLLPNLSSVVLFNMAVDPCDPDAASCPTFTRTWPRISFEYSDGKVTAITKAGVGRTAFTYGSSSQRIELAAGPGTRSVSYSYQNCGALPPNGTCPAGGETVGGYRVQTVTSAGRTWTYSWEPSLVPAGRLEHGVKVTSAVGTVKYRSAVTVAFGNAFGDIYLPAARVIASTDELSRTTNMEYVGLLNPRTSKVTYPEGNGAQYTYDQRGNVNQVRTFAKPSVGGADQVITITRGDPGTTWSCAQPAYCNKAVLIRDARGYVTRNTWNVTTGLLEASEAGLQGPDASNLTCALGTGLCPKTRYGYELLSAYYDKGAGVVAGLAIRKLSSIATCEAATTCQTNEEIKTSFGYGAAGVARNLLVRNLSVGKTGQVAESTFDYNGNGDRTLINGPRTDVTDITTYEWDVARRPTLEVRADNSATKKAYDTEGYLGSVADGSVSGGVFTANMTTSYLYDSAGNVTRTTSPSGIVQTSYDGAGRLLCTAVRMDPSVYGSLGSACALSVAEASATEIDRITRLDRDAAGQVLHEQSGYATTKQRNYRTYEYTLNGKPDWVEDANGNRTDYTYDGFDRLEKFSLPSLTTAHVASTSDFEGYGYDANNNRTSLRLRSTETISYRYDALNRMDQKAGAVPTTNYAYDLLGRRLSATTGSLSVTNTYDPWGRALSETSDGRTLNFQYDLAGNRTRLTWPDGNFIQYTYDATGRTDQVRENGATSGPGLLADYGYDALGRRNAIARAGGIGVSTSYGYDASWRLQTLGQDFVSGNEDRTLTFGYNPANQILSRLNSNTLFNWTGQNNTRAYTANKLNQMDAAGGQVLSYSARGNLEKVCEATAPTQCSAIYAYDLENRLTNVSSSLDATGHSLSYDPLGRLRRLQTSDNVVTQFQYEGQALVAEYSDTGVVIRRHVPGPGSDETLVTYEGANLTNRGWLITDNQGSVVGVTDATANLKIRPDNTKMVLSYDEYGNPGLTNIGRFQYTGQSWLAEVGLNYYKARMYAPAHGRFLQTDPVGYADGLNWYAYVGNDPTNRTDPTGMYDPDSAAAKAILRAAGLGVVASNPVGDTLVIFSAATDAAGKLGQIVGEHLRDKEKQPQMYYRALTREDRASLNAGKGISATNPNSNTSMNDHVAHDTKPSPYISMTKSPGVAADYSSGNGIVLINPDAVRGAIDLSAGSPLLSAEGNRNAISDVEVLARGNIPQSAIAGIVEAPRKR
jgi:RHS repeat-associated protein